MDKESYQSGDIEIDNIVNEVSKSVLHTPHPHAYEITGFKLEVLLKTLMHKKASLLEEEFNAIDLDDSLLNGILSEKGKEVKTEKINSLNF